MLFTLLATIVATSFWAQQPLCPVKEGVVLTYASKDAKGKVTSYSRQTVTSITGSSSNHTLTYSIESLDAKKRPAKDIPIISYSYKVENGTIIIDPKAMLNGISTGTLYDSPAEGTSMLLPANMKAGDKLPDCDVRMFLAFFRISAIYTEGVCEGEETITTEAGTFTCVKTKYNCKGSFAGVKTDMVIETWYAPGIGMVKQEAINTKGKFVSLQELVELQA